MKTCSRCKTEKPLDEFSKSTNRADGLSYWCKGCSREQKVEKRYGLTPAEYDALLAFQGGVCGVCGKPPKEGQRLSVDHSHRSKKIRGLLDTYCNYRLVGAMSDNVERVAAVYAYMVSPPAEQVVGERYVPTPPRKARKKS